MSAASQRYQANFKVAKPYCKPSCRVQIPLDWGLPILRDRLLKEISREEIREHVCLKRNLLEKKRARVFPWAKERGEGEGTLERELP